MQQSNIYRQKWLAWALVVGWMGLIFYLSHQPASASSALSSGVVQTIVSFVESIFSVPLADSDLLHVIVRKGAHLFAYFVLALFVFHAFQVSMWTKRATIGMTIVVCVLYAVTDEVHQLFIPGRSGQVTDVLIDTIGSVLGIGCYLLGTFVYKRFRTNA